MKNDVIMLKSLVMRSVKVFLKDKASVFFSLLAPLIILVLYVLFLGDLQIQAIESMFAGTNADPKVLRSVIDSWMLAGAISIACITVSFSAHNIMIRDREDGVVADMLASPIKRWVLSLSYYAYNVFVTLVICSIVLIIAFIYIAITGWYLSVGAVFAIIGLLIVSVLSSSLISTIICKFIKTGNAHSAFVGILSAAIGFLCGAYMPITMFPTAIQYVVLFVPGTYSAALFRNLFMGGPLNQLAGTMPEAVTSLRETYSLSLNFFGTTIESGVMWAILVGTIALFAGVLFVIGFLKKRRKS